MNRFPILLSVASLILGATLLHAAEDHTPYRVMRVLECNECHKESGVAPNHIVGWVKEHRFKAVNVAANCSACHEQSFCLDCHYGGGIDRDLHVSNTRGPDYKPKSHRTDFREIHPLSAKDNPRMCEKCHAPKFCEGCHSKYRPEDLQFESHRRQFRNIPLSSIGPNHANFTEENCQQCHPGGQVPSHRWSAGHAREARRDLASCQACHGDGDTCIKCHGGKGGLGMRVNPHPENWDRISGKLRRAAEKRTCVKCH